MHEVKWGITVLDFEAFIHKQDWLALGLFFKSSGRISSVTILPYQIATSIFELTCSLKTHIILRCSCVTTLQSNPLQELLRCKNRDGESVIRVTATGFYHKSLPLSHTALPQIRRLLSHFQSFPLLLVVLHLYKEDNEHEIQPPCYYL